MKLPNLSQLRPQQMAFVIIGGLFIVLVLGGFYFFSRGGTKLAPVSLTVWGTTSEQVFYTVSSGYKGIRSNVTVTYKQLPADTYRSQLLDALAAGEGPDVFMIDSHDLGANLSRIVPAPTSTMDITRLRSLFPKAVEQDLVVQNQVYGLPLSMDTLALLYNKDLLDAGGVVNPPATWDELQQDVTALRSVNEQNQVVRAAVALGGSSKSIPEATDILNLFLIQDGAAQTTASSSVVDFGDAGAQAFDFYLQFANPVSPYYTWSDSFGNSTSRFAKGDVAMLIGYSSTLDAVRRQNPFLDIRVASVPQATGGTPRDWPHMDATLVVSKQSKQPDWAWDFVANAAGSPGIAQAYLDGVKQPPALSALIAKAGTDDAGIFAKQSLIARSWYQMNGGTVADILDHAITDASSGVVSPGQALRTAADQITALYRKPL